MKFQLQYGLSAAVFVLSAILSNTYATATPDILKGDYFDASVSIAYTNWEMVYSLDDDVAESTGDASDRRFDTQIDPYLLKVFDARFRNLYGFDVGLNYLTDKAADALGFSAPDDVTTAEEKDARQLALFLNRRLGDFVTFSVESKFRKFTGQVEVVNAGSLAGESINFYSYNGKHTNLAPGDQITWSTASRELALLGFFSAYDADEGRISPMNFYIGYRNLHHQAPAEFSVDNDALDSGLDVTSLVTYDGTYVSDINVHTFEFGLVLNMFDEDQNGLSFNIPVNLGWYNFENSYFETDSAMVLLVPFDIHVQYGGKNWKLVAGLSYRYMFSVAVDGQADLKKDMVYKGTPTGDGTLPAGTTVNVFGYRTETMWGPYFSFAYSF